MTSGIVFHSWLPSLYNRGISRNRVTKHHTPGIQEIDSAQSSFELHRNLDIYHIMSMHAQRSRSHKEVTVVNRGGKMKIAPTLAMNKLSLLQKQFQPLQIQKLYRKLIPYGA